jgi:addiction module HigA family antidote
MASDQEEMKIEPPHPGEMIREDILPALGMTIKDLAQHLGVSRVALSELVNGRRAVSPEMAQRLAKAFGNSPRFWLTLQMQYDIWHAERSPRAKKIAVKPLKWEADAA